MSAAQRVLVDRELRRRRQLLRVHQHQHAHVGIDLGCRLIERPDVEELLRLAVHRPGLAHLAGLRIEARAHRQRRQPAHHRFPGVGELINELDDVVLEELLLVVIEPLDGCAAVGAGRDGVEAVLRQIQPPAAQCVVEEDGESDEQQREREERAAAECRAFVHGVQSALRSSSAIAVASRKNAISIAKYSRSRKSMTPFWMDSKWVRNESEATASMSGCGAQLRNTSSTSGKPASRNMKHATTARMNATT